MIKSILNLKGIATLTKEQQKLINGGGPQCTPIGDHEVDWYILEGTGGSPPIIYCLWNCGGQTVPGGCQ